MGGGGKKGLIRSVADTARKGAESATESVGLGKGAGRTLFTYATPVGMSLEAGAMVEDMARAPTIARQAAKEAASAAKKEQDKLLGAAKKAEKDAQAVELATEESARLRRAQISRGKGKGRQSTILTGGDGESTTLGASSGKTLLGV